MKLLVAASPGEVRVAAWQPPEGLFDYAIWRPGAPDGVGDLHRGRIIALVPAMAGAFVALDGADGFLPDSEGGAAAGEGVFLGVRITRAAQAGKGPRLTARLSDAERALVGAGPPALLRHGPNAVQRLAELHPDAPVVVDDPSIQALLGPALGPRLVRGKGFDDAVEAAVEALAEMTVGLPGGARLSVHPTPALTITLPSRSARKNCSPASAPPCADRLSRARPDLTHLCPKTWRSISMRARFELARKAFA